MDAVEINPESATQLENALSLGHRKNSATISPLRKLLIATRVTLDPSTWLCPVNKTRQHLVSLHQSKKKQLHDDLLELVKDHMSSKAAKKLKLLSEWLESRNGQPYTVIVDGANVKVGERIQSMVKAF